jgi:hypothetical protein
MVGCDRLSPHECRATSGVVVIEAKVEKAVVEHV